MAVFAMADGDSDEVCEPSMETCGLEVCRGNEDCDSYLSSSSFMACMALNPDQSVCYPSSSSRNQSSSSSGTNTSSSAPSDSDSVEICEPSVETCALEVCRGNEDCDSYLSSSSFMACTILNPGDPSICYPPSSSSGTDALPAMARSFGVLESAQVFDVLGKFLGTVDFVPGATLQEIVAAKFHRSGMYLLKLENSSTVVPVQIR